MNAFARLIRGLTAKAFSYFLSGSTGTGAEQSLSHGLGRVPDIVLVIPTNGYNGSGAVGDKAAVISYGTHTSSLVKVTVSSGATYKIIAL